VSDFRLPRRAMRTRFAPSPTGYLHIGGARTALFAWAAAKKLGGEFVLRIEDTDKERSTEEAKRAITASLDWLGIGYDGPYFQSERIARHREIAHRLVEEGKAYRCYMTPEELDALRKEQERRKQKPRYDRRWRDCGDAPPAGVDPVIRFKSPLQGRTLIPDLIKGNISIDNRELDDPVILRADGTPTYNFACGVDDWDMAVTHVIRGEDHISNTPKQMLLIDALGGPMPAYAHMPLILARAVGEDGAPAADEEGNPRYERMSKRNGAVDVMHYKAEGFLPEGLFNYLACLGWSPGVEEIFGADEFVGRFDLKDVNLAASRFDLDKLKWTNNRHMRRAGPEALGRMTEPQIPPEIVGLFHEHAKTLREIEGESAYFRGAPEPWGGAASMPEKEGGALRDLASRLESLDQWEATAIKGLIKETVSSHGVKFKDLGMPLRSVLTGRKETPDISQIAAILGKDETLARVRAAGIPVAGED